MCASACSMSREPQKFGPRARRIPNFCAIGPGILRVGADEEAECLLSIIIRCELIVISHFYWRFGRFSAGGSKARIFIRNPHTPRRRNPTPSHPHATAHLPATRSATPETCTRPYCATRKRRRPSAWEITRGFNGGSRITLSVGGVAVDSTCLRRSLLRGRIWRANHSRAPRPRPRRRCTVHY